MPRKDLVTHLEAKVSERQEGHKNPVSGRLNQLKELGEEASDQAKSAANRGSNLEQSGDGKSHSRENVDDPSPTNEK